MNNFYEESEKYKELKEKLLPLGLANLLTDTVTDAMLHTSNLIFDRLNKEIKEVKN